jgi:flotillin
LAKVDHITVVSTGNGDSAGLHKITGDLTQIAAQVPELFEALSGMKMSELLGKIKTIGDNSKHPDQLPSPEEIGKAPSGRK